MQLSSISIDTLEIPFKVSFQHSSAVRTTTEAILVTAVTTENEQGLGEGCPRRYVTGETIESSHNFFNKYRSDFLKIKTLEDLKTWSINHQMAIDKNPAAFCAVEIALLNIMANQTNSTIESLLSLPELSGEFQYTGVLGVSKPKIFNEQLQQYLRLGFNDFKIKIIGDTEIDQSNIKMIKKCERDDIRVRLDANNLWSSCSEAINYIKKMDYPFVGLEEPLNVRQYDDCIKLFEELGIPIILDESFTKEVDFEYLRNKPEAWIINIRVSKMGGLMRSLNIAEKSKDLNFPIIIGAQVGETSILTRAALTVANNYRSILLAQEGAFGTNLLEHDVIDPPICFGEGGILKAEQI